MRVTLRYLRLLPSGKYQFRRVWPENVRASVPDLSRELKRTFDAPCKNSAIRVATQLNIEFERIKREASRRQAQTGPTWQTAQQVAEWFEKEKRLLDQVITVVAATDQDGVEIEIEETQRDFEIERILEQARTRSGVNSAGCEPAWKIDPFSGVIGVEK